MVSMTDADFFKALNMPVDFRGMGKRDCELGSPAKNGMPEAYYLGFSNQYAKQEQQSQGRSN